MQVNFASELLGCQSLPSMIEVLLWCVAESVDGLFFLHISGALHQLSLDQKDADLFQMMFSKFHRTSHSESDKLWTRYVDLCPFSSLVISNSRTWNTCANLLCYIDQCVGFSRHLCMQDIFKIFC